MFADFVDGADIGMIESGRGARLPAKSLQGLRIKRQFIGKKFEGDKAAKLGVLSFIDHTHAATAELLDDAVVRNCLVDHWLMSSILPPGAPSYGRGSGSSTNGGLNWCPVNRKRRSFSRNREAPLSP